MKSVQNAVLNAELDFSNAKEEVSQWLSYASKVYNKRGRGAYFASVARFDTQNTGLTFSGFICLVCKQPMNPYITLVIFTSHQNRMEYKSCDRKKETFRKSSRCVFCCCSSFLRNARVFNR